MSCQRTVGVARREEEHPAQDEALADERERIEQFVRQSHCEPVTIFWLTNANTDCRASALPAMDRA